MGRRLRPTRFGGRIAITSVGICLGTVALAAPAPGGGSATLVELKLSALEGGALHLGTIDGPMLSRTALPYALPSESELQA